MFPNQRTKFRILGWDYVQNGFLIFISYADNPNHRGMVFGVATIRTIYQRLPPADFRKCTFGTLHLRFELQYGEVLPCLYDLQGRHRNPRAIRCVPAHQ